MAEAGTADLGKGKRITGGDRSSLADDLRKRYDGGESIRSLATSTRAESTDAGSLAAVRRAGAAVPLTTASRCP